MIYGMSGERTTASRFDGALNTALIAKRRIECKTGYYLSCEAVADLTVEARKFGASSWTDIEMTPIDLSADNGNVIVYEFRFTGTALGTAVAKINVGR